MTFSDYVESYPPWKATPPPVVPSWFFVPQALRGFVALSSSESELGGYAGGESPSFSNILSVLTRVVLAPRLEALLLVYTLGFTIVLDRESVANLVFCVSVAVDQCTGAVENSVNGAVDVESEAALSESSPNALNFCSG